MKKGFTLIELLVVVLIIGILSAIALPQYTKAVEKARASEAMIIMRSIADANKRYHMANGTYATLLSDLDIDVPGSEVGDELQRRATKYFEYGCKSYSTENQIAVAQRLPSDTNYALAIDWDGLWWCKGYSAEGVKNCKMLGATNATATDVLYEIKH